MLYTLNKSVRNYLIDELQASDVLSEEEIKMAEFARKVEQLYPNESFDGVWTSLKNGR